jgi:orotate phosphoribosyltransferase
MNDGQTYKEFMDAEAILKGHFILSSGLHSDTYLQCARVLMDPLRADRLCRELADKVKQNIGHPIDMVVAPAMGGVVVGYEMGRQLKLPSIFCERVDGEFELRRGFSISQGARILLVEDVVTTGKSSLEAVECIKHYGGKVVAEACLIDRSSGRHGLPFPLFSLLELNVPTYAADNLPEHLQGTEGVKPGSRHLSKTA